MKATKETIAKRVEEIADLRLLGAFPKDIFRYAEEQEWSVSERNIYFYISDADKLIAKSVDKARPKLLAWHHAARRALYARCMAVSDYGTAARVMKDEAELLNLYPEKVTKVKAEHTGKDGASEILIKTIEVIHASDDSPAPGDAPEAAAPTDDGNA
jgi:hypothetical protein